MTDADILILIVGLSFVALLITGLVGLWEAPEARPADQDDDAPGHSWAA